MRRHRIAGCGMSARDRGRTDIGVQYLLIERAITDDTPDGQPWPPALQDRWHLIRSLPGARTLWRRISLNASANTSNNA